MKKTVWLVFRDGGEWSKRHLKEGFGHIDILMKDNFNWYIITPKNNVMEVKILSFNVNDTMPSIIKKADSSATVVKVETDVETAKKLRLNFGHLINCVGAAKYLLGIWPLCYTPWGLYKWLNKIIDGKKKCDEILSIEIV